MYPKCHVVPFVTDELTALLEGKLSAIAQTFPDLSVSICSRPWQPKMPRGDWAIVGLGAGAMASYVEPGQMLTYYEIDPLVAEIAEDPRYFTFLTRCGPGAKIVLGDARLKLRDAPDSQYGLIALDAFSGDSIPVHLMTREALALYLRKLAPGGLIAFHISNLYFDLTPTLGNLAKDAGLVAVVANDTQIPQAQADKGKLPSIWVVMARNGADMDTLTAQTGRQFRWQPLNGNASSRLWTDDYSNMLGAVKSFTYAR